MANTPAQAKIEEMQAALSREEAKTGRSGAIPNTPKARLLDASDVQAKKPEKHFRWLNQKNSDKMMMRTEVEGYERVPVAEGGREVGNLVLGQIDKDKYLARKAREERENQQRLKSHEADVQREAEGVARHLRDKHGINVRAEDIMTRGE